MAIETAKQISTWLAMVLGAVLLATVVVLFTPSTAPANPTITWTPSPLSQTISVGTSTTIPISFSASDNVKNVDVRVVPELEPYVKVAPSSSGSITKGQTVSLTVTLFSSATSLPGTFQGTIQLRSGSNPKKTFARPLPVELIIEESLAGNDSDRNGVRDDIQEYIAVTYPDSEKTRAALTQIAKTVQAAILNADNKETSIKIGIESIRAIDCLGHIRGNEIGRNIWGELRARILNTVTRTRAYLMANQQLGGQIYPGVSKNEEKLSCDFDVDAMGN